MLTINTNLSSLIAQSSMKTSTNKLNQAIERMTTGFKINHASDNAANYSILTNLTTKINACQIAEDNVVMGMDMLTTAEDNLSLISDKLNRLRDLATLASNGTYGINSLSAINAEAIALVDEINRLYTTAEYNGIRLFNNSSDINQVDTIEFVRFSLLRSSETPNFIAQIERKSTIGMRPFEEVSTDELITSGEYSISTDEDLAKLAEMANKGLIQGGEYVLANNIDLSAYKNGEGWVPIGSETSPFCGVFDGNGYIISNLKINAPTKNYLALFGNIQNSTVKNLGVVDLEVNATRGAGVVYYADSSSIENCFSSGTVTVNLYNAGGLLGNIYNTQIKDSYSTCTVNGYDTAGGLIGSLNGNSSVSNSYATGNVSGDSGIGGFVGCLNNSFNGEIINSYSTGSVTCTNNTAGGFIGLLQNTSIATVTNCYTTSSMTAAAAKQGSFVGTVIKNSQLKLESCASLDSDNISYSSLTENNNFMEITKANPLFTYTLQSPTDPPTLPDSGGTGDGDEGTTDPPTLPDNGGTGDGDEGTTDPPTLPDSGGTGGTISIAHGLKLQIGINSNNSSHISLDFDINLQGINDLKTIGLDLSVDYIVIIDEMLATVNAKQVEYGSVQNRLESALEEISTQYDNLVSSRSTIRDADIAEVSSHYIQQQILQQASATLLATANQSPSIALQLI